MANLDAKFIIEHSAQWTRITVDSMDYVIRFDINDAGDEWHSISCWLSDFSSMWTEVIEADTVIERLKERNKYLACNELMATILSTITAVPRDGHDLELTAVNENDKDMVHLHAKYYLSDGTDEIPLKFYWSLEKCCIQSFYAKFINSLLLQIMELEKSKELLCETIRKNGEELDNLVISLNGRMSSSVGVGESDKENRLDDSAATIRRGICHEGLTCNNCLEDIYGYRYKCVECEDYDLCLTCEQKQVHTQHIMVRYAHPDDKERSERLFQPKPKKNKRIRFSN